MSNATSSLWNTQFHFNFSIGRKAENFNVEDYLRANLGEKHLPEDIVILLTVVYVVIFLTGMFGNVCTCIVVMRNSYMHTATNYYLLSLAMSDLVSLFLALPPELYSIWEAYPWRFGEPFCIIKSFVLEMTSYASVLTITAFTIERYFAICHPILSQKFSDVSRVLKIILLIWLVACLCALPYPLHSRQFYYLHHPETEKPLTDSLSCSIPPVWLEGMSYMFQVSTFLFFVAPMTIITVMYVLIGMALRRSEVMSINVTNSTVASTSKARRAVLRMLVAVVVAFFLCWAPFHAQRLMTVYISPAEWTEQLLTAQTHIFYLSGVLYFVSSTVNPILYNLMSRKYRHAFRRTLCRCCLKSNQLSDLSFFKSRFSNDKSMTAYTSLRPSTKDRVKVITQDLDGSADSKV